jgi:hypothetical protein
MTTPTEGVNEPRILSEDDATQAFLDRWTDAEKPSAEDEGETNANDTDEGDDEDATLEAALDESDEDETAGDEADDQSEDDTDEDEGDDEGAPAGDDLKVTVTVDGEDKTVTVKELKRLYGQEASLTRKSQEVAAARKVADAEGERYMIAAQKLLTRAEERFAPFAKIDWMVAQQRLTPDEFAALREEARAAHQDLSFLNAETEDVLTQLQTQRQAQLAEAAKDTIATLERDIPGWNKEVYDQVRNHAVSTGMAAEVVNTIVDPAALKLMHDAMRYRELKARAAAKKQPITKPKAAAPKKVVKPASKTPGKMGTKTKGEEATARLRKSGKTEDAVAALLSRWTDGDDA